MTKRTSTAPYGGMLLDLGAGPLVVELPAGPLIVGAMDINQRWVADMGLPGPDAARAASTCCCRRATQGKVPAAATYMHKASSNRQIVGARSLPVDGDVQGAKERLKTIKVYPLDPAAGWTEPKWLDVTGKTQDTTPSQWEDNLRFWEVLHEDRRGRAAVFEATAPTTASWRRWASRRASRSSRTRA